MKIDARTLTLSALALLAGCQEKVIPEPDFERMDHQERCALWEPCEPLPDGRTMQHPPEGTVARDSVGGSPEYRDGITEAGQYTTRIPVTLTLPLVQRGQQRFETFCAPCHGVAGDGSSRVAHAMTLRHPPSLVSDKARSFAAGRLYQVITEGYGLMPRFSDVMPDIEDRWAVVAYLRALQTSRGVALDALPPEVRARAHQELNSR
jgi:hypothetical protein